MGVFAQTLQFVVFDLTSGLLRWPIWWYTKGLVLTLKWARTSVKRYVQNIALLVWIKNLFVPMYGLRDWQGRIISFFVRLVQIFFRGIFLLFYLLLMAFAVGLYLVAPVVAIFELLYHLVGSVV